MAKSRWSLCGATAALVLGSPSLGAAATSGVCGRDVHTIRPTQLRTACAMHLEGECEIVFAGAVAGSEHLGGLHYQLMKFSPRGDSEVVVFGTTPDGKLRPVSCAKYISTDLQRTTRDRALNVPRVHSTSYGKLLEIPAEFEGNAGAFGELLYVWRRDRWKLIDTEGWRKSFKKRISPTFVGWMELRYDIPHMKSECFLYASKDAHVSPSGYAKILFDIRDDKLEIRKLAVGSSKPIFEARCKAMGSNCRHW